MKGSAWTYTDVQLLIRYYKIMTIKELLKFFPDRSAESINAKIKRLKAKGKIVGGKDKNTIKRALEQREKSKT